MSFFKNKKNTEDDRIVNRTISPGKGDFTGNLNYNVANLQGIGARQRQEDSFTFVNAFDDEAVRKEGMLFAVCDGMGGMKDGKVASETAVSYIRNEFANMNMSANIAAQMKNILLGASDAIENLLEGDGGSTAVVGLIYQNQLYYVSVGDSFLYLIRDGMIYRLNHEHNLCNQIFLECIRSGRFDPGEGRNDSESAALTHFLGMTGLEDIDGSFKPLPLKNGDVLLACSDGVGGTLDEDEILNSSYQGDIMSMCNMLEQGIVNHNKLNQDNYTAIVVRCICG